MVVTNVLGLAFTATLLSVSDSGVTFVFPEDGATNTMAWSRLSPASRESVWAESAFVPIPAGMVPTWQMAEQEVRRITALVAGGRLSAAEAASRRAAVRAILVRACRDSGLSARNQELLLRRLPVRP